VGGRGQGGARLGVDEILDRHRPRRERGLEGGEPVAELGLELGGDGPDDRGLVARGDLGGESPQQQAGGAQAERVQRAKLAGVIVPGRLAGPVPGPGREPAALVDRHDRGRLERRPHPEVGRRCREAVDEDPGAGVQFAGDRGQRLARPAGHRRGGGVPERHLRRHHQDRGCQVLAERGPVLRARLAVR
jgi:hypothetical protein